MMKNAMLRMNESKPSEKFAEMIASMPGTNKSAASIRVIEILNLEERKRMTSMDDHVKEMSRRRCERVRCQKRDRNTKRGWTESIYIWIYMYMNDGERK